jgi:hypothetical protein
VAVAPAALECPVKNLLKRHLGLLMNLWPPLLGAGIRVTRFARDFKEIHVEMKLRRWNTNYVGTHYGGSLYSMTDPFYMLMLLENLGRDYIVWDKSASIRFRKPGKGTVSATFRLSDADLAEIRTALETAPKIDRVYHVNVTDQAGTIVAQVRKEIYIRKKAAHVAERRPPILDRLP